MLEVNYYLFSHFSATLQFSAAMTVSRSFHQMIIPHEHILSNPLTLYFSVLKN